MIEGDYYLAHPLVSRREVMKWELEFEKRTGIMLINPFYDIDREDIRQLDAGVDHPLVIPSNVLVERDLALVKASRRGLLAVINGDTIGTFQEMVYAKLWGKLVYSVILNGKENHAWIIYHSDRIFPSLAEFERFILA